MQLSLLFELVQVFEQLFHCLYHQEADLVVLQVDLLEGEVVEALKLYQRLL